MQLATLFVKWDIVTSSDSHFQSIHMQTVAKSAKSAHHTY